MNNQNKQKTHCDRCGKDCRHNEHSNFVLAGELVEVKSVWQSVGVTHVCKLCGNKANSFIDYYGKKTSKDKIALKNYLQSGDVSSIVTIRTYSSLINGGYYV